MTADSPSGDTSMERHLTRKYFVKYIDENGKEQEYFATSVPKFPYGYQERTTMPERSWVTLKETGDTFPMPTPNLPNNGNREKSGLVTRLARLLSN